MHTKLLHIQQYQLPVRSRLCGVWRDPRVGSLTFASITTHKEADSERPTQTFLRKPFAIENLLNMLGKNQALKI